MQTLHALAREGLSQGFLFTLPSVAAEDLVSEAIRLDVPAGAVLYREDERPRILLIVSGLLRVFIRSSAGRQVTVRYVRAGDVVGLALAVGGPAPVSVQAVTAASVLGLSVAKLAHMMSTDAEVARSCAAELAKQLFAAFERTADSTFLSVRQRVLLHLLDLAVQRDDGTLVAQVTQQGLADAVGSAREIVARVLHDLREARRIRTQRDLIVLLDAHALAEEVGGP